MNTEKIDFWRKNEATSSPTRLKSFGGWISRVFSSIVSFFRSFSLHSHVVFHSGTHYELFYFSFLPLSFLGTSVSVPLNIIILKTVKIIVDNRLLIKAYEKFFTSNKNDKKKTMLIRMLSGSLMQIFNLKHSQTECSFNFVFFEDFKLYSGLLPGLSLYSLCVSSVCTRDFMLGL